jgi:hypothetical protein
MELAKCARWKPEQFYQDDENRQPLNFFKPIVEIERLHPSFEELISRRWKSPARVLLSELMNWYEDVDGNFVEQLQTTGFDSRLWELYLYATFTELGYAFNNEYVAPDFFCEGLPGKFCVEATTVNPSAVTPKEDLLNEPAYFQNYVPIKFGSALFSKLKKKYWELPHVRDIPLVLAIQDFHQPRSMSWSAYALPEYLYGIRQVAVTKHDGSVEKIVEKIQSFKWENKEVPAGFFLQPETAHISAVIANPGGTLAKFDRMGFLGGFGNPEVIMFREGMCFVESSEIAQPFSVAVNNPEYSESWVEGLSVYHNPNAIHPLPAEFIPGAAHFISKDDGIESLMPSFHPLGSITMIFGPVSVERPSEGLASEFKAGHLTTL